VQCSVCESEDFKVDPMLYREPVKTPQYRGDMRAITSPRYSGTFTGLTGFVFFRLIVYLLRERRKVHCSNQYEKR